MFKTKLIISGLALVVMLFCSSRAYSQFDDIFILEGEGNITSPSGFSNVIGIGPSESLLFSVLNPSNLSVDTLDFVLSGFSLNPSAPVSVVGVNGLGIFDGVSATNLSETVSPFGLGNSTVTGSLSIASSAVAEGNIAELILDTTGVPQSFPGLVVDDLIDGLLDFGFGLGTSGIGNTTFLNDGAVVPTDHFLTLGFNVAVPEPSAAGVLFALGSLVMMRRKRT